MTVNQANYWPKWPKVDPNDRSIIGMTVIDVQNHLAKWLLWFPKMIVSSIIRKNLIRKLTKMTVIKPKSPPKSLINLRGTNILDENGQYLITTRPFLTVIRLQVYNILCTVQRSESARLRESPKKSQSWAEEDCHPAKSGRS